MHGRRFSAFLLALVLWGVPRYALAQQENGVISGTVIDTTTHEPVPSARVDIVGTSRSIYTSDKGAYALRGVAPGTIRIRATRVGYAAREQTVTVVAGQSVTVDFALKATPSQLDVVTVTATGGQQLRRENPASVSTVQVDSINLATVQTFSDVMTSRTPGVVAQSAGGTAGSGTRIRIRGSNSVSLQNDPLVIIDGVRADDNQNSSTIGVGGQVPSRLDDLNPDDIESVDVIKGPAASSLYGTAAANGVIQITTKRGRPGTPTWNAHLGYGQVKNSADFPANFAGVQVCQGGGPGPACEGVANGDTVFGSLNTSFVPCSTEFQLEGACVQTGIAQYNPLVQASPFVTGNSQRYGLSVAGGSDAATYYLSGDYDTDQGIYEINKVRRANLRANATAHVAPNFDVTINSGYLQSHLRLPQNDNDVRGIVPGGLLGLAFQNGDQNGYRFDSPQNIFSIDTEQNNERYTGAVNMNWRPLSWLSFYGIGGLDYVSRLDEEYIPTYLTTPITSGFADDSIGKVTSNPYKTWVYTLSASATASYRFGSNFTGSSSVGSQYNNTTVQGTQAFGAGLAAGTSSLAGTSEQFAVTAQNNKDIILGWFFQQQIAWRDRVFFSGTVRADKNNAFGKNFSTVVYPGAGVSWVISDEGFFPHENWVNSVRLRAAYGQSGQQPGFRDSQRYFTPVSITSGGNSQPGFTPANIGNPDLKPERTTEYEGGIDATLIKNRLSFDFTYYNKDTKDALIQQQLPPSNGNVDSVFLNLGKVNNKGIEYQVNATALSMTNVRWDIGVNGSHNTNKVVDLGAGIQPIIFNNGSLAQQRQQDGYPLGGYWAIPYTFEDKNHDGIISRLNCPGQPAGPPGLACEVTLGDNPTFIGSPFPTDEISFNTAITFLKYFRVSGLLDRRGGYRLYNLTEEFRCADLGGGALPLCLAGNNDVAHPVSSLADQAALVAATMGTGAGYVEDASFWKLREIAATFYVPPTWARKMHMTGLSLTLAGRNLATWTNYKGLDPEVNEQAQSNFNTDEFLSQPPVRTYTVRLDLTF